MPKKYRNKYNEDGRDLNVEINQEYRETKSVETFPKIDGERYMLLFVYDEKNAKVVKEFLKDYGYDVRTKKTPFNKNERGVFVRGTKESPPVINIRPSSIVKRIPEGQNFIRWPWTPHSKKK